MTTPAARALQKLSPRVVDAPIYNYLAREARMSTVIEKLSRKGVRTVRDFILASETTVLSSIRTAHRKKITRMLRRFGVDQPARPVGARRRMGNGHQPA